MTEVLLVDDHPLFRQALQTVIAKVRPELTIVEAQSLAGARAALGEHGGISLVLLDLKMRDCDGFAGLLGLRSEFPHTPIAIVSASDDPNTMGRAVAFGAVGFIPKIATQGEIGEALHAILAGDIWVPPATRPGNVSKSVGAIAALTPPQLKILLAMKRGLMNKQIAAEIGISEATVKSHITAIFRRMGVTSRTQAVIAAEALTVENAGQ